MRANPLLVISAALLGPALIVALGACGGEEEAAQQLPTGSSTVVATAAATLVATATPTAAPTATPSVPEDWKAYSDPGGFFTVRYPSNWFQEGPSFSSYDLSTWDKADPPPEVAEVEVFYRDATTSDTCGGTLYVDRKSGQDIGSLPGATATTLGGAPAWELVRTEGDPLLTGEDVTRVHRIAMIHSGKCVFVTAYYTQKDPDVAVFLQILSTFEFKS